MLTFGIFRLPEAEWPEPKQRNRSKTRWVLMNNRGIGSFKIQSMQLIATDYLANERVAMYAVKTVLRMSGVMLMGMLVCQSHCQAQENQDKPVPALDQNVSKSIETATFGLG